MARNGCIYLLGLSLQLTIRAIISTLLVLTLLLKHLLLLLLLLLQQE